MFFVMLYVNGVLCGWLYEAWREQPICAVEVEAGGKKPAGVTPAPLGGM
jgi:hypothetical protein